MTDTTETPPATASPEDLRALWRLIHRMRFCMLTHRHPGGGLHAHPLTTQNRSLDEGALYFFVSRATELGRHLGAGDEVNVSYADPREDRYVSVTGRARELDDPQRKERLFNALARAWFPAGPADPQLALVEVRISHAAYWEIRESKATQLFKLASAAVTGQPPTLGRHREMELG